MNKLETLKAAYNGYYMLAMRLKDAEELEAANAYALSALKILERIEALTNQPRTEILTLHLVA